MTEKLVELMDDETELASKYAEIFLILKAEGCNWYKMFKRMAERSIDHRQTIEDYLHQLDGCPTKVETMAEAEQREQIRAIQRILSR